jgi:hypothetical protein
VETGRRLAGTRGTWPERRGRLAEAGPSGGEISRRLVTPGRPGEEIRRHLAEVGGGVRPEVVSVSPEQRGRRLIKEVLSQGGPPSRIREIKRRLAWGCGGDQEAGWPDRLGEIRRRLAQAVEFSRRLARAAGRSDGGRPERPGDRRFHPDFFFVTLGIPNCMSSPFRHGFASRRSVLWRLVLCRKIRLGLLPPFDLMLRVAFFGGGAVEDVLDSPHPLYKSHGGLVWPPREAQNQCSVKRLVRETCTRREEDPSFITASGARTF